MVPLTTMPGACMAQIITHNYKQLRLLDKDYQSKD